MEVRSASIRAEDGIAALLVDDRLVLWDWDDDRLITTPAALGGEVESAEFDSAGRLVVALRAGQILSWSPRASPDVRTLSEVGGVSAARMSRSGEAIVVATEGGGWVVLRTADGDRLASGPEGASLVAVDERAKLVALGRGTEVTLVQWALGERRTVSTRQKSGLRALAFAAAGPGARLLGFGRDIVEVWDASTGVRDAEADLLSVGVAAIGRERMVNAAPGKLVMSRLADLTEVEVLSLPDLVPASLAMTPDARVLLVGGVNGRVRVWCASP